MNCRFFSISSVLYNYLSCNCNQRLYLCKKLISMWYSRVTSRTDYDKWRVDRQYNKRWESNFLRVVQASYFSSLLFLSVYSLYLLLYLFILFLYFSFISHFPLTMFCYDVLFLPLSPYLILPYNFTVFRLSYSEKLLVVFILTENCICFMHSSFLPLIVIYR